MKAYPKYKDSGVEWLGEIPEGWQVKKLKYLLSTDRNSLKAGPFGSQLKNSELDENGDFKVYNQRTVLDSNFSNGFDFINEEKFESLKDFEIFESDILITTRGTIGKAVEVPKGIKRGVLHPCLIKIKLDQSRVQNQWLINYVNDSSYFKENVFLNSNATTIEVIYTYTLREIFIPLPSDIAEQKAIATYLARKTSQIDSLIEKKKRMIELLKEERAAIINQAVTKGINPDVEMKDSGIEWLGEVPKHWVVVKLSYVCGIIQDGTHFSPTSKPAGEFKYITAKNIKENGIDLTNITYLTKEDHEKIYQRCPVKKGDVLYIKDGATAGIATVNNLSEEFSLLSSVAFIRPIFSKLLSEYLCFLLNMPSFKSYVLTSLVGGAMTRFTLQILNQFRILLPPIDEQKLIVKYVKTKAAEIEESIKAIEKELPLLEEYRTALINEAVTGKIDVRGFI